MENHNNLFEKKKTILNKWNNILFSWIKRFNIINLSILPNLTCKFNTILNKSQASYFVDTDKLTPKFMGKVKNLNLPTNIEE